jgi:UDPglucose 6-dehydrogenase
MAEEHDVNLGIVDAVIRANEGQKEHMVRKIRQAMGTLKGKTIGILGISFKPNTDDVRDAPAISIIRKLLREGARVRAYDPVAMKEVEKTLTGIRYCKDAYDAVKGADALVIVTEWNQFRNLDLNRIKSLLKDTYFFDLRNIYDPRKLRDMGFRYHCVGRP